MSVRMQTWFPYRIQIAVNGREWLARQLEKAGVGFTRVGNKIHDVSDFSAMQPLLDQQLRTDWCSMLDSFVPIAFPTIRTALDNELLHYSWNVWQSEWASDLLFKSRADLDEIMDAAVRHAFIGGHPERLLRYFDRPTRNDGQVRSNSRRPLKTTIIDFDEGHRVRHWLESNSVKLYNEGNVLRIETTINDPYAFRAYRRKQGAPPDAPKKLRPLRKGVADTTHRARVSQDINNRLADHLATMQSDTPLGSILQQVTSRKRKRGRSVRALEPTGKDLALLSAIADPRFTVGGFQNKHIRNALASDPRYRTKTSKQQSGMTTRAFRLLRDHGLIRKLPKSRRYQLTADGRQMVTAVLAALASSTQELTRIAA